MRGVLGWGVGQGWPSSRAADERRAMLSLEASGRRHEVAMTRSLMLWELDSTETVCGGKHQCPSKSCPVSAQLAAVLVQPSGAGLQELGSDASNTSTVRRRRRLRVCSRDARPAVG